MQFDFTLSYSAFTIKATSADFGLRFIVLRIDTFAIANLERHPYICSLKKLKSVKLSILVRNTENLKLHEVNFSAKSTIAYLHSMYSIKNWDRFFGIKNKQ